MTLQSSKQRVSVIIPTLNAGMNLELLFSRLKAQSVCPDEIIVVDSESDDGTAERAKKEEGVRVIHISRQEFDHGRTRDYTLRDSIGELVLFLTQDAVPCNADYIKNITEPFKNPNVSAVSGRQIAKDGSRRFEQLVRSFNYPAESRSWTERDISSLGIRAFLISDVCSAYRRSAYLSVGGFDYPLETNEDMLIAEKMLRKGYTLYYSSEAAVYHSHDYTWIQEYHRNVLIGRFLKQYEARFNCSGEDREGVKLVQNVLKALIAEGKIAEAISFCANCSARLIGNRVGKMQQKRIDGN